jgi:hypothetical protein
LDTEVNVSKLTVVVDDAIESQGSSGDSSQQSVDVEVIEDVILGPHETRTVSLYNHEEIVVLIIHMIRSLLLFEHKNQEPSSYPKLDMNSYPFSHVPNVLLRAGVD